MNKRKRMKTIRVAVPDSVYGDFAKGHVSRGSLHIDENGEFFFIRHNLGSRKPTGPRKKPRPISPACPGAMPVTLVKTYLVVDAQGQMVGVYFEFSGLSAFGETMAMFCMMLNQLNKGGAHANN